MKIPLGSYAAAGGLISGFMSATVSYIITFVTNTLGYTNSPLVAEYLLWYAIAGFISGMVTVYIMLKDISGRGVLRRKPRY
ncbi:MAG TPA: hypothetical protein VF893_00335 [Candidatus Bathyarchaeia archaeon]